MDKRETQEQMAMDDLFFAAVFLLVGFNVTFTNWVESDWWGFVGGLLIGSFAGLWLGIRIYHLTHKDKVFGNKETENI